MLGDMVYQEYASNTFSHRGKQFKTMADVHYVHPHRVSAYTKKDGTFVKSVWRDGDGNTKVDRMTGYFAGNPNSHSAWSLGGRLF